MIAASIAAGLTLVALLSLLRLLLGPTLYDRALALVSVCVQATLIAAAIAVASGRGDWLDASFALAAATFVLAVVVLKFVRGRSFQAPLSSAGEAG